MKTLLGFLLLAAAFYTCYLVYKYQGWEPYTRNFIYYSGDEDKWSFRISAILSLICWWTLLYLIFGT